MPWRFRNTFTSYIACLAFCTFGCLVVYHHISLHAASLSVLLHLTSLCYGDRGGSLPEQLFLDFRVSDVLDKSVRLPRVEPWASQYCATISEMRYGDAIYARYHMDGRAIDGVYTDLRETKDGSCEWYNITVY
jgi:hypothetical protein